jgi:Meiotically up-regulated gene 113
MQPRSKQRDMVGCAADGVRHAICAPCPRCDVRVPIELVRTMFVERGLRVVPPEWLPNGKHGPIVYAVQASAHVKVGTTEEIRKRVKLLQVGNPYRLNVIGMVDRSVSVDGDGAHDERTAHRLLEDAGVRRAHGEWFEMRQIDPRRHAFDVLHDLGLSWLRVEPNRRSR